MIQAPDWPGGTARIVLDEVDSTMAEARRRAPGLGGPTWIMAHHQGAAVGRRGRAWAMPEGNFAATLVIQPAGTPAQAALRSFTASLALYDAVRDFAPAAALALKWPNDVLLSGGKLAGILLENNPPHLSIGIGVNLAAAPDPAEVEEGALRPVSLAGSITAPPPDPEAFLSHLAAAFAAHEAQFAAYGFAPLRSLWLSRAARLGEAIRVRTTQAETHGTFETIDADGNLVLLTPKGRQSIPAGDVYF
ncbi:biotin--[acetyl-CoA-carboxylase] ligase [Alphaproteobacteria bacterium KMM 3653]|uniref:biotin--[biotin carboxyl-carrier protein] ligase n=1 Tax=Harenicola maris TaxID=2841044 RepID=A0AAP2CMK1_9RHOB|nr:biotin--[acetyl-CoA-carboxylase] ligase [Harenicola maris]